MMMPYRSLTNTEIALLEANHCSAENWDWVTLHADLDIHRIHSVKFYGKIRMGDNRGMVVLDGLEQACGIHDAVIKDCVIGNDVLIERVGSAIQNYNIGDHAIIRNIHALVAEKGATFGHGVQVNALNEAGGREVTLFRDLNAQLAYLQAVYKGDATFQQRLATLIDGSFEPTEQGVIGAHAVIRNCISILNVHIGPHAVIEGAAELVNGAILSCAEHPTRIGHQVILRDVVVSEGASIRDGALLEHVFVGQAAQIGKQFSAEHSLFFANCEAFHSEACSIFAGPYSVTHHRSTLLIAALFSFYNAGSGTNLSNHMYKLGPVHQGIFERGCKTGSFSYILLESHIPAFSVVIGKHMGHINIPDFPFSYLTEEHSESFLTPGKNLFSVGTARDGQKWPARDRRKTANKRDLIIFDVFSPYTIEKMRRGRAILQKLYEHAPKDEESVHYGGVQIRRLLLRKGVKYYNLAINRYLLGQVLSRLEKSMANCTSWDTAIKPFTCESALQHPEQWTDIAGLLAPVEKIDQIIADVRDGKISTVVALLSSLQNVYGAYRADEWDYVCHAFAQEFGMAPRELSRDKALELIPLWGEAAASLNALTRADAAIEFADFSQIGYGLGGPEEQRIHDFQAVRGKPETNSVIKQLDQEAIEIKKRIETLTALVRNFGRSVS